MRALFLLLALAPAASAGELVPARTIRAKEVITASDLMRSEDTAGSSGLPLSDLVGKEARITLYPGRTIHPSDIGEPALVDRNELVTLVFHQGPLRISVEGRALARGASGERVQVMNLASRGTIVGTVQDDGTIKVE